MTFDELFKEHRLTPDERTELVWRLATLRMQKTLQALLPKVAIPKHHRQNTRRAKEGRDETTRST